MEDRPGKTRVDVARRDLHQGREVEGHLLQLAPELRVPGYPAVHEGHWGLLCVGRRDLAAHHLAQSSSFFFLERLQLG